MRKRALSLGVGILGAAGLMGIAWSVLLIGLPPPVHADLVAARAARWLNEYRAAVAVFHAGGHRVDGLCLNGSTTVRHSKQSPSSLLVLVPGRTLHVIQTHNHERVLDGMGRQDWPGLLAANAGCTYQLLVQIGAATRAHIPIDAEPAFVGRQPAIALRLSAIRRERLTLYVAPDTYRPLAAAALIGGQEITARLRLAHLDPELLARFGLHPHQP